MKINNILLIVVVMLSSAVNAAVEFQKLQTITPKLNNSVVYQDSKIKFDITRANFLKTYQGNDIQFVVFQNMVLITGIVPNYKIKSTIASDIKKNIPHIEKVYNKLEVGLKFSILDGLHDRLILDDLLLKFQEGWNEYDRRQLKVVVFNSTIYLFGEISRQDYNLVHDILNTIIYNVKVNDILNIKEEKSNENQEEEKSNETQVNSEQHSNSIWDNIHYDAKIALTSDTNSSDGNTDTNSIRDITFNTQYQSEKSTIELEIEFDYEKYNSIVDTDRQSFKLGYTHDIFENYSVSLELDKDIYKARETNHIATSISIGHLFFIYLEAQIGYFHEVSSGDDTKETHTDVFYSINGAYHITKNIEFTYDVKFQNSNDGGTEFTSRTREIIYNYAFNYYITDNIYLSFNESADNVHSQSTSDDVNRAIEIGFTY